MRLVWHPGRVETGGPVYLRQCGAVLVRRTLLTNTLHLNIQSYSTSQTAEMKLMFPLLEIRLEVGDEVVGRDGLVGEVLDVRPEERFEHLRPSHRLLQAPEEGRALLVRHPGEGVVRVGLGQVGHQGGQRVLGAEVLVDVLLEVGPVQLVVEVSGQLTIEPAEYLPVEEDVEAFIDPEVLHVGGGDEVAGPGVGDLVGDDEGV